MSDAASDASPEDGALDADASGADAPAADAHESDIERPTTPVPSYGVPAIVAFVALVVCTYVAAALYADLVVYHPVGLIALSARARNLLGALGSDISWWTYGLVGGVRLALGYGVCHLIGRAYGDRVYYLFGRYLGVRREAITSFNELFDRFDWLVVPWWSGSNLVAAITGVRRMNPRRLVILLTIGIVGRLVLLWVVAAVFADELDAILEWIARYQQPLLIASTVVVVLSVAFNVWRGRDFEMEHEG